MGKRNKRLQKGVDSLQKQIELHEKKRQQAVDEGKIELADYYGKEIKGLVKSKENKEEKIN